MIMNINSIVKRHVLLQQRDRKFLNSRPAKIHWALFSEIMYEEWSFEI